MYGFIIYSVITNKLQPTHLSLLEMSRATVHFHFSSLWTGTVLPYCCTSLLMHTETMHFWEKYLVMCDLSENIMIPLVNISYFLFKLLSNHVSLLTVCSLRVTETSCIQLLLPHPSFSYSVSKVRQRDVCFREKIKSWIWLNVPALGIWNYVFFQNAL